MKKISTTFAVALGAAALAACNQSPQEQAAENIEANAENAAAEVRAEGENAAEAVAEGNNAM